MKTPERSSMILHRLSPWMLLLPVMLLMIGIFSFSLIRIFDYSLYGYVQGKIVYQRSIVNYLGFFMDSYYLGVLWNTIRLSALCTFYSLLLGYPLAYAGVRIKSSLGRQALLMIVFLPLVISVVVRSYGWFVLMSTKGMMNWLLGALGLIDSPISLMYTETAVLIGMVHVFLPFMVFPILSSLKSMNPSLREAAYDLGASKWQRFVRVTFPLSLSGVLGGVEIVFTLGISAYVTPVLLGGGKIIVLSRLIYNNTLGMNWPMAATSGVAMLLVAFVVMFAFNKMEQVVKI